jgi:hypothetical protein
MIQNVLSNIGGVEIYGVISVCLFLAAFVGTLLWAFQLKKGYLDSMRDLPLHRDDAQREDQTEN